MADEPKSGRVGMLVKAGIAGVLGLGSGVVATYSTAIVQQVAHPARPLANFAVSSEGLTVTCQHQASGESGWWDFCDGTPLEPFRSDSGPVTHAYAKPGNYSVKLTVRNFLMEENERTVPVDLSTAAPAMLPPSIAGLTVESVQAKPVAPATFRIRGEVKNAEKVIWDLGDKVEISTDPGPFERLVVFEKPGQYPIQLIGHSGKTAVKQGTTVTVTAAAMGSLSAVIKVQDSGSRTVRDEAYRNVIVPMPPKGAKTFERPLACRPGSTIAEAKLGKLTNPAVANVKLQIQPDKLSVKVTGDWVGSDPTKAAGGTDVLIPVTLVEDKSVPVQVPSETMAATLPGWETGTAATIPLPPQPRSVAGFQRKLSLEIREATADGKTKVIAAVPDMKLPFAGALPASVPSVAGQTISVTQTGDAVRVALTKK